MEDNYGSCSPGGVWRSKSVKVKTGFPGTETFPGREITQTP